MAVAHDAWTEDGPILNAVDPHDFTHTPSGTPKGVVVILLGRENTPDAARIVAVTYGGETMTQVVTTTVTAGSEDGFALVYFLGTGIPTGAQTVSIDHDAAFNVELTYAYCATVTAAEDTEVGDSDVDTGVKTNPQVALTTTKDALRYFGTFSGLQNVGDLTLVAGMTAGLDEDFGTSVVVAARETAVSSGATTVGWTAASDDVAMVGLAIQEVDAAAEPSPRVIRSPRYGITRSAAR